MPKFVCDAPDALEQVEYYTLVGLPGDPQVYKDPTGEYGFQYELGGLAPGPYSLMVSACNNWQCSISVPFDFTVPGQPSQPTGLSILFS
jgi:hypothetical protein